MVFCQYGYTRTISVESDDIPAELIYQYKLKRGSFDSLEYTNTRLCKDDDCIYLQPNDNKPFIEIKYKNGYLHRYILIPYINYYETTITNFIESNKNETIHVSTDCKTDNQCFSNKCINNRCVKNLEVNIEYCDTVYLGLSCFIFSHIYYNKCGRMSGESCINNSDCSFDKCYKGTCVENINKPSDSEGLGPAFEKLGIIAALISILVIDCCCCCYVKNNKRRYIKANK
ncbi:hypothetical protein BCR36DRAFT_310523 [Piromyces finnis]|uniref:Uncharacterized protein n=1 Tax=Piromyces finnis TaxID=1754191 RepID=A0A1Y1UUB3_9FUNG|nr:hypothetical protein BCR36DRAFT_310523 [Piromyces finnis]|eukprot:ORX41607.1 hypothetical protein BCR36DRAFT_310523 [Piromyces finnis]